MKYSIILAFCSIPFFGFNQTFGWDFHTDTIQSTEITYYGYDFDVSFDYDLVNYSGADLELRWRLFTDLSPLAHWKDNICEGSKLCFPAAVRTNDFTLPYNTDSIPTDSVYPILHHIVANTDPGTGYGIFCVFDPNDSANTVQCRTMQLDATLADTVMKDTNGTVGYEINGEWFEVVNGEYLPLGTDDLLAGEVSGLSQNAPNPFSSSTMINFSLTTGFGSLKVHDLTGKLIYEYPVQARSGQIALDGELDSGIYFYSLWEDGIMVDSKRMQVID